MANDIDKTSSHYKGEFSSIYEVNQKYPSGGVADDYVVIDGWAHYWNADRGTWCVNAKRDEYWDELITSIIGRFNGYAYMGVATTFTVPPSKTAKIFYFALTGGKYANFGNIDVPAGISVLITEDGKTWKVENLITVAQELGVSTTALVSQKALSDAINAKTDVKSVNAALDLKANKTDVDAANEEMNAIISEKADLTYVDSTNAKQDAVIVTKANQLDVENALKALRDEMGERVVIEGDVSNHPDEEDLTSKPNSSGTEVLSLKDRKYNPLEFSGKGYKILRKNPTDVTYAVSTIEVTKAPTSDGYVSIIINSVESHVDLVASTDTTVDAVAKKIAEKLTEDMEEYVVSVDAATVTCTRKIGGSVTASSFSDVNTGAEATMTESANKQVKNILTGVMVNQPNTIYEVRYDFDLNGETITIPDNCTLKFEGGSIGNGTLKVNEIEIIGYRGFTKSLILSGTVMGDAAYFDWWQVEKFDDSVYVKFVKGGYLDGPVPEISDTNRTILQNNKSLEAIKFGRGIYPFDDRVWLGNARLTAENEHKTLLWAPKSDFCRISLSSYALFRELTIEANGHVLDLWAQYTNGQHGTQIYNCTFISYNDDVVYHDNSSTNKAVPYGWDVQNLKIYGGPGKSAFRGLGSNSMIYRNVVDNAALFNNHGSIKTSQRGLMHSMFYNCSFQQFSNSNMTYGGWKYFFYYDLVGMPKCHINNCTFEGGDSEHKNIARIIEITKNQNWAIISIENVFLITNNFDVTPIHIEGAQNKFVLKLPADINTLLLTNINRNADVACDHTLFYISDTKLDANGTRRRVGCIDPHIERGRGITSTISIPVAKLVDYGFPQSFKDIFEEDGITDGNIYAIILSMTRGNEYVQLNYLDKGRTMWHITKNKQLYWDGLVWRDSDGNQMSHNSLYHLSGCYINGETECVIQPSVGSQHSRKIYPNSGYNLPTSITITMGGTELVQGTDFTYDSSSGVWEILGSGGTGGVTGDIVVTAEAVKK